MPVFVIEFVSRQQEVFKCECTLWLFESLHLAGELAVDERERKWWKHSSTPEANGRVLHLLNTHTEELKHHALALPLIQFPTITGPQLKKEMLQMNEIC